MRILPTFRILACLALSGLVVQAQSTQRVNVTFRTFGLSGNFNGLSYKSGTNYSPLKVTASTFDDPNQYSGSATMELVRVDKSGGGSSGKTSSAQVAGTVEFPQSGTYAIAIQGLQDGKVAATIMPDSIADFPGGSFRFLNTTRTNLTIQLNSQKYEIKAGECKIVPMGDTVVITFLVYAMIGKDLKPVQSQTLTNDRSARTTVLIVMNNYADYYGHEDTVIPNIGLPTLAENINATTGTNPTRGGRRNGNGAGNGNGGRNNRNSPLGGSSSPLGNQPLGN